MLSVQKSMAIFPEADSRQGRVVSCAAAGRIRGSGAQKAESAKPWDSATWQKAHAAGAREKAALRRVRSLKSGTNGRSADRPAVGIFLIDVRFRSAALRTSYRV